MDKKKQSVIKIIAVVLSLVICLWAVIDKVFTLDGTNVLMKAVGMEEIESSLVEQQLQQTEDAEDGVVPFLESDEMVPYNEAELPDVAAATPDPDRAYNTVEEILIADGVQVDNFRVKDTTGSGTDLVQELLNDPTVQLLCNGEVEVLIYHTHTTEAYVDSFTGFYYTDMNTRTQNQDMSVVAVGEEIRKQLEAAGIGVVHDTTINDLMYSGSYSRSWEVLQNNLAEYPTIQVTIDIHRDSMTTDGGIKYKPTVEINGRKAAQVMILAGCDANGGWGDFPNWLENLRFALRIQQKAGDMYPNLMRPLNFGNNKYNMNATSGSILIEVGTEVNTISEAVYSGQLVGEVLAELLTTDLKANT